MAYQVDEESSTPPSCLQKPVRVGVRRAQRRLRHLQQRHVQEADATVPLLKLIETDSLRSISYILVSTLLNTKWMNLNLRFLTLNALFAYLSRLPVLEVVLRIGPLERVAGVGLLGLVVCRCDHDVPDRRPLPPGRRPCHKRGDALAVVPQP